MLIFDPVGEVKTYVPASAGVPDPPTVNVTWNGPVAVVVPSKDSMVTVDTLPGATVPVRTAPVPLTTPSALRTTAVHGVATCAGVVTAGVRRSVRTKRLFQPGVADTHGAIKSTPSRVIEPKLAEKVGSV